MRVTKILPWLSVLLVTTALGAPDDGSGPIPARYEAVVAVLGADGGIVRLAGGFEAILMPGTARQDGGRHRVRLEPGDPRLPPSKGVGPRPIDRRSNTPLGPVEGPPVAVGPGFRIHIGPADAGAAAGTGAVDAETLALRRAAMPERVMPYWEPAREVAREGVLIMIPDAAPKGKRERLSAWLWTGGGMRRAAERGRSRDLGQAQVWDPCFKLGRLDEAGNAWFYLDVTTCGLDETPFWTPLREQSQKEFAAWVLERTPDEQVGAIRRELKRMARAEKKEEQAD
jgi:hypothetical protein